MKTKNDNNIKYTQLATASIQDSRNVVISKTSKGGYTIAQQLVVDEDGRKTAVFMAGSLIVKDINGMRNFRDALNIAIEKEEG